MILETVVGRSCWDIQAGGWRDVTTPHAGACKEEQQSQTHAWMSQRVRSGLTQRAALAEDQAANIRAASRGQISGQLPFLG